VPIDRAIASLFDPPQFWAPEVLLPSAATQLVQRSWMHNSIISSHLRAMHKQPPTQDQQPRELSDGERALLLALYESSPDGSTGVNALQFRVSRGKEQKPLIRRLEDALGSGGNGERQDVLLRLSCVRIAEGSIADVRWPAMASDGQPEAAGRRRLFSGWRDRSYDCAHHVAKR
jgi:hypothetical protein